MTPRRHKHTARHVDAFGRTPFARRRPVWFSVNRILQTVFGVLLAAFVLIHSKSIPWWALVYLGVANAASFVVYGYDKSRARRGKFRISEWALHGWSLAGGTLGAIAGQLIFRHKIYKLGFQLIFDAIVITQLLAILWWLNTTTQTGL